MGIGGYYSCHSVDKVDPIPAEARDASYTVDEAKATQEYSLEKSPPDEDYDDERQGSEGAILRQVSIEFAIWCNANSPASAATPN